MMQLLQSTRKILATSLFIPALVFADIGNIFEQTGVGNIERDNDALEAAKGVNILLYDTLNTGNGRIAVNFLDDSNLRLTEHSRVLIDEVIYDPNPSKSKMTMKFAMGTARFTSGKLGLVNKANIDIQTPTASIGIRGTDFTTTVDELGRSLVILLPDANGDSSGEIVVSNQAGEVTLTEAYQATMVSTIDTLPAKPVTITNISVAMIDNMFIVNPPAEVQRQQEEQQNENSSNNILDADFLEFNDLEQDYLDENELEYTELDRDLLDVDFLQDLLEIIEEADLLTRKKSSGGFESVDIVGTLPGFDKDTQYQTIVEDNGKVWFYREVTGIISIRLVQDANARIQTITDEKESIITMGDGESISIIIRQTN
tara:strand:+ start:545 stop:1657 length:1113 start_codon:yes stop_codon:yes gene_type:complete